MKKFILITGADGFIGKNLTIRLGELSNLQVMKFVRGDSLELLSQMLLKADLVINLAGENRPYNPLDLNQNQKIVKNICDILKFENRKLPIIHTSSVQIKFNNPYGKSKLESEAILAEYAEETGGAVVIYRLPGVFGKWCKPNYNSVVATFCYNVARDIDIEIHDPLSILDLVYIDDFLNSILKIIDISLIGFNIVEVSPVHKISVGELADTIKSFKKMRTNFFIGNTGSGLLRALYSTFISYLPSDQFVYNLPIAEDNRGIFVETFKSVDFGQFSYFTAKPGVTRGSHYHHTKTEKFVVVKGLMLMRQKNLISNEFFEVTLNSKNPQVVESIPGWAHQITNIGKDEAIVIIWANEVFDYKQPDCIASEV